MPRKTRLLFHNPNHGIRASMRPRPDAAENLRSPAGAPAGHVWSFNEAAARCRGKRAGLPPRSRGAAPASMRPRPDAAENGSRKICSPVSRRRFNEAAARCRGKRRRRAAAGSRPAASMRPRPDAAENGRAVAPNADRQPSFNEAAARCRGKPAPGDHDLRLVARLQ